VCVGVFGAHGTGKTTYLEHLLVRHGLVDRLGKVEEGTSHLAADPEETRRLMSLAASVATVPTPDGSLFFLDTPGEPELEAECVGVRAVADVAVLFTDAGADPGPAAVATYRWARDAGVPCLVAVTKLDKPHAQVAATLERLATLLETPVLPLALPLGEGEACTGVLDLLENTFHGPGHAQRAATPAERTAGASARAALEEAAAEGDDTLLARYLDDGTLADADVARGVTERAAAGALWAVPVCPALDMGIDLLMDTARRLAAVPRAFPAHDRDGRDILLTADHPQTVVRVVKTVADPYVGVLSLVRVLSGTLDGSARLYHAVTGEEERPGQIFTLTGRRQTPVPRLATGEVGAVAKLTHVTAGDTLLGDEAHPVVLAPLLFPPPVFRLAVRARHQAAENKLGPALRRLVEEDPTLHVRTDPATDEMVLEGLGETHLEVAVERLARKFGVEAALDPPRIPYRETLRGHARAEGKHKKQSGGHGQYGHVVLEVEPLAEGDFAFVDKIFGGAIPQAYRPAVEKGVREAMMHGVLAGYPVTGVRVTLVDGSSHPVDSSELAFKIAAALAFEKACRESQPVLLEPILEVEVACPEPYAGSVLEDLQRRRAHILGMVPDGGTRRIEAQVPEAEMLRYSTELRSLTGGWGQFRATRHHYAEVPPPLAERIVARRQETAREVPR